MRHLAILLCLSIVLTACVVGEGDAEPTPTATSVPVTATSTPVPTETAEPEPTEEPSATSLPDPTATSSPVPTVAQELPTATPEPTSEATATATADPVDVEDIDELVRQIAEQTASIRGLEILEDINVQVLSPEQMGDDLIALMLEEYTQEDADLDRDLLWMLRLIDDRALDYMQLQLDLSSGAVLGYYNPETGELFVASGTDTITPGQKLTMAHEIIHALQDQHFGLDGWSEELGLEAITGFQSLVEGEASFSEVLWGLEHLTFEEILEYIEEIENTEVAIYNETPRYVLDTLLFPYNQGYEFVDALYIEGGYELIDAAFIDPPVSSEQILHPEKYIQDPRDMPIAIEMPATFTVLDNDWELVYEDTLGEFDMFLLLEINGITDGTQASEGWGGAGFEMFQSGDDLLITLVTRWDTLEDAGEFHDALQQTMEGYEPDQMFWFDGERYHAIVTNGDMVILTTATDRDTLVMALAVQ